MGLDMVPGSTLAGTLRRHFCLLCSLLLGVFPPFVYNLGDEGSDDNSTLRHARHTPLDTLLVGGLQRCSFAGAPLKLEIAYNEIHGLS
jgi:hypothetical protein